MNRSSTMSQPTATRPCVDRARRARWSAQQHHGARDRDGEAQDDRAGAPAESDAQGVPRSVTTATGTTAPGIAMPRTASRSLNEKWMPTPNMSRITPSPASSVATAVGEKPRGERPDDDAREDIPDDRRQSQATGHQAAHEAASRPTAMVAMRTGSWSMALPVVGGGGAQDWRGSVPERRRGIGRRHHTRDAPGDARTA